MLKQKNKCQNAILFVLIGLAKMPCYSTSLNYYYYYYYAR